jgi:uncharacterized protein
VTFRDGQACIVQGALRVRDGTHDGQPAVIVIPPQCVVVVDGYVVTGETTVCSKHSYEVVCEGIEPTTKLEVSESSDGMSVTLTVHLTEGKRFRLADSPWGQRIELRLISEPIPPIPPTPERLDEVFRELGFVGVYDVEAIQELSTTARTLSHVVVRGTQPTSGKAATYRVLTLAYHNDVLHRFRPVNMVQKGTVVAVHVPTVPGVDGTSVRGKNIPAPISADSLPRLGDGLELVDGQLVATRAGRFVHSRTVFDVIPSLVLDEDVVAKDGFIEFDGDITITGSVMDGSVVRATGLVTVQGGIYGATVVGFGGVQSGKSVAKSRIVAGREPEGFARRYACLGAAIESVLLFRERITEAVQMQVQVRKEAEQGRKSMHSMNALQRARSALNDCFSELKHQLQNLCAGDVPDERVDDRWSEVQRLIRGRWQSIQLADTKMELVQELDALLNRYRDYVESLLNHPPANVELESIVSSAIFATGDIRVSGRGVISSALECNGSVEVNGFVRGGSISAETGVKVQELGSTLGVETHVSVLDPSGHIDIRLRHPNTLLEIGGVRHRNDDMEHAVVKNGMSAFIN